MNAGRKLDALVAEHVMGYAVRKVKPDWYPVEVILFFHPAHPDYVLYSSDERSCNAMMFRNGVDDSQGTAPPLPAYSEDIEAAWEVAEKLNIGLLPEFDGPGSDMRRTGWVAGTNDAPWDESAVHWAEAQMYGDPTDRPFPWAHAESAPLAICLAALKVAGVEVPA